MKWTPGLSQPSRVKHCNSALSCFTPLHKSQNRKKHVKVIGNTSHIAI